jgi:hypothetical protein
VATSIYISYMQFLNIQLKYYLPHILITLIMLDYTINHHQFILKNVVPITIFKLIMVFNLINNC